MLIDVRKNHNLFFFTVVGLLAHTMGIQTIATELLGIEHPIVCGGMTATGSAELAAAGSCVVSACVCVCLRVGLSHPRIWDGMKM